MRALIPIILWLIFSFFAYNWVQDKKVDCGCDSQNLSKNITPAPIKKVASKAEPILYNWSKAQSITNNDFGAYKDSILASLGKNRILEITGLYRKGEVNNTTFADLGMARANDAKKLFEDKLDKERFRLLSKQANDNHKAGDDPFRSALFRSIVFNESVKEIDNKARIYHPYNQARKITNAKIDAYLKDAAERVIKSGETITLTGNTDSDGDEQANYNLGLNRANEIKRILVGLGVSGNKIVTKSVGELNPVATNNTDIGKKENRRTELEIN